MSQIGQTRKYSPRAHVFRSAPNSGHRATLMLGRPAAFVKVCGCRPMKVERRAQAGVRKPPMEETAGGVARWRVRRRGDLAAVSASTTFAIWHEFCEGVKTPFAAPVISES